MCTNRTGLCRAPLCFSAVCTKAVMLKELFFSVFKEQMQLKAYINNQVLLYSEYRWTSLLGDAPASLSVSVSLASEGMTRDSVSFGSRGRAGVSPSFMLAHFLQWHSSESMTPSCSCRLQALTMRPQGTKMALGQAGWKGCATHTPPGATLTRALGEERDFMTHHSSSKGLQHLWFCLNTVETADIQHLPRESKRIKAQLATLKK